LTCKNLNFTKYPVYFSVAAVLKNNNEISSSPKIFYPPEDIKNFTATSEKPKQIKLSWKNPPRSDFKGTLIRFKTTKGVSCTDADYPADHMDGELVGNFPGKLGASQSHIHSGLDPNLIYCYSAFSYDSYENYTHTAHTSAQPYDDHITIKVSKNSLSNPGEVVDFTVQANGAVFTFTYNFGDGKTLTTSQNKVSHKYLAAGTYMFTVTIKDKKGHSVKRSEKIKVSDIIPAKPGTFKAFVIN